MFYCIVPIKDIGHKLWSCREMEVVLFVGGRVLRAGVGGYFSSCEEFSEGDFGGGWTKGGRANFCWGVMGDDRC